MSSFANLSLPNRIYGYDFIIIAVIASSLLVTHLLVSPQFDLIIIITLLSLNALVTLFWLGDSDGTNKSWVSYVSITFGSFLIGFIKLDLIFTFVLTCVIFIRTSRSSYKTRGLLPLIMITMIVTGYLFTMFVANLNYLESLFSKVLVIPYVITLLLLGLFILIDWLHLNKDLALLGEKFRYSTDRINKQLLSISNLSRFVPNQTSTPIIRGETPAHLYNKRTKLTVFFSDIVNFTELSDNLSPDDLAELLSNYMNVMTMIADEHGATLDKFIGDGMMCFFGADNVGDVRENAIKCVNMAIHMRREMRLLGKKWKQDGFAELSIRMGINTGFCHLGNFGTDLRMSYTVIGKEVNLASRLESVALPNQILVSDSTYEYIAYEHACIKQKVSLKGLEDITTCWQVLDPDESSLRGFQWIDYDLPGFNLHLNLRDADRDDYAQIKKYLAHTIDKIENQEEQSKYDTIDYSTY